MNPIVITVIIIASVTICIQVIFWLWDYIKYNLFSWKRLPLKKQPREVGRIEKPWGGEEVWIIHEDYVGKILYINAGHKLSNQYHKKKNESIRILSGQMMLHLEWQGEKYSLAMYPGDVYHIHQELIHRMEAVTDVKVLEVSTNHLDDIVRLSDDYGRV